MKERTAFPGDFRQLDRRAEPHVAPPQTATESGIEVREEEWRTVTAQRLYKLRCECGRSWFELELPEIVKCPACDKLGIVSDAGQELRT